MTCCCFPNFYLHLWVKNPSFQSIPLWELNLRPLYLKQCLKGLSKHIDFMWMFNLFCCCWPTFSHNQKKISITFLIPIDFPQNHQNSFKTKSNIQNIYFGAWCQQNSIQYLIKWPCIKKRNNIWYTKTGYFREILVEWKVCLTKRKSFVAKYIHLRNKIMQIKFLFLVF